MEKENKRKLLWYRSTILPGENLFEWSFLIINKPRELDQIKERLYNNFKPIHEIVGIAKGVVAHLQGMHYDIFSLLTGVSEVEFYKIYNGKVRKEDRLKSLKDNNVLDRLVEDIYSNRI